MDIDNKEPLKQDNRMVAAKLSHLQIGILAILSDLKPNQAVSRPVIQEQLNERYPLVQRSSFYKSLDQLENGKKGYPLIRKVKRSGLKPNDAYYVATEAGMDVFREYQDVIDILINGKEGAKPIELIEFKAGKKVSIAWSINAD